MEEQELIDLLKAHEMACVTDFIDEDYEDDYFENTDLDLLDIKRLSKKYEGYGTDSLEEIIINKLKDKLINK